MKTSGRIYGMALNYAFMSGDTLNLFDVTLEIFSVWNELDHYSQVAIKRIVERGLDNYEIDPALKENLVSLLEFPLKGSPIDDFEDNDSK
jgi:hypothetical protein